jgi:hypothetical protein
MTDTLFDPAQGVRNRDRKMAQVEAHADPAWKVAAQGAIRSMPQGAQFTTDELWQALVDAGAPRPLEPKAIGPEVKKAAKLGLCRKHDGPWRASAIAACNRRPKQVWVKL